MARTSKTKKKIKDTFWEIINEELDSQLSDESCLARAFCQDLADSVVDAVSDTMDSIVDDLLFIEDEDADALPFRNCCCCYEQAVLTIGD